MSSTSYNDSSQGLLASGYPLRERALKEAQWHSNVPGSFEYNWISYHTTLDDARLFTTAKDLFDNLTDAWYDKIKEDLVIMTKAWGSIGAFRKQRLPPRNRRMLEGLVNSFYIISNRANISIEDLPKMSDHVGDDMLLPCRYGIPAGREDESFNDMATEQPGSPESSSNIEESVESPLEDHEFDSDASEYMPCLLSGRCAWKIKALPPKEYQSAKSADSDGSEFVSSDKSDGEYRENETDGTALIQRKRKAGYIMGDSKKTRLGYILN